MANEKMMILKMLEEGKITATEAARLMEASGGKKASSKPLDFEKTHTQDSYTSRGDSTYGSAPTPNNRPNYNTGYAHNGQAYSSQGQSGPRQSHQGPGFDNLVNDLGRKFDTFAKDMEPKLQKFSEVVVEKTSSVADSISRSISQSTVPSRGGDYHSTGQAGPSKYRMPASGYSNNSMEKNFEILVQPGYCELNLTGLNGDVLVNGYNGDKITAKINYRPKRNAAAIDLMKLGDKYYLNYDEDDFEFVTIDAYVPEKMFKNIRVETINAKIILSTIITESLTINGINAKGDIKNVSAENLFIDTSNGELALFGINGKYGKIDTFNASVNATGIDIENMSLTSNNAPVTLNIDYFARYTDYTWAVEAANGKLIMNIPSAPDLGYYVKAKTSLNNVKLGLTGMEYIVNNNNFVEAKSYSFDAAPKKVRLSAETSNAPLSIN